MDKLERVKTHLKENKAIYIGTAVGVAGLVGGAVLARRNTAIVDCFNVKVNSPTTTTLTQLVELVRRGHPGKVVKDHVTGEVYASINRAVQATGLSRNKLLSEMGMRFEYLGDAQ